MFQKYKFLYVVFAVVQKEVIVEFIGNALLLQNDEKVREPQKYHQATVVNLSKPRDPNLRYSLGDTELDCEDSDAALEAKYMTRDEGSSS